MLNHLAYITEEINESKNSRLFLDDTYSSLLNDTNPKVVDDLAEAQYDSILDTLKEYRLVDVKRERLQYLYEQTRAQNIRSAIPNPVALLSATQSLDLRRLVGSIIYMAVDSATSYKAAGETTDMKYLQDGWELDDEEMKTLQKSREDIFFYMIDVVHEYDLPENLTLSEKDISNFVSWKNKTGDNTTGKIRFFESNEDTYSSFGPYWLALAQAYYDNEDYKKCLDAIDQYETTEYSSIFRKDDALASMMPVAIAAAQQTLSGKNYIRKASHYLELIDENTEKTDSSDWAIRYYAAQTYLDLYNQTSDTAFLQSAYDIVYDNVNLLLDEQLLLNQAYLSDVETVKSNKDATDQQKKEIKEINKLNKNNRKIELPPVSEPLILNCDLLFSLADQLKITDEEQNTIDAMLHRNGDVLFLTHPLNNAFTFNEKDDSELLVTMKPGYKPGIKQQLRIPAAYLTTDNQILLTVTTNGKKTEIDDWKLIKVTRKEKDDIDSFQAIFESAKGMKYKYKTDSKITLSITPKSNFSRTGTIKIMFDYEPNDIINIPILNEPDLLYKFEQKS